MPIAPARTTRDVDVERMIRLEVLLDESRKSIVDVKDLVQKRSAEDRMLFDSLERKIDETHGSLERRMQERDQLYDSRFVSKTEFLPVRSVVFGFVGIVLVSVITAIVYLVVKS